MKTLTKTKERNEMKDGKEKNIFFRLFIEINFSTFASLKGSSVGCVRRK
jgi:hypothetical protein